MAALTLNDLATRLPSLQGRVAVVSGGGGGTGRASAELLARLGAAVGVLDIDASRARTVAEGICDSGGSAIALVGDVARASEVERAASTLEQRFGPCDALVNDAHTDAGGAIEETALADWDRMVEVELTGAMNCLQVFGRRMLAGRGGTVVNVCAAAGEPSIEHSPRAAGRTMLGRLGAVEWGSRGIRVNSIQIAERADPQAVAAAAAFLSGDGSSYVTGENFQVDQEEVGTR